MFKLIKKLFSKKPKEEKPLVLKKEVKQIYNKKDTRDTKSSLTFGV
jgi:hypothetical protein